MKLKDYDLGWLVAILEGEGCFILRTTSDGYRRGEISCNSTDEDVIRTVHKLTECGTVAGPMQRSIPNHKPFWSWKVTGSKAITLMIMLHPYMHSRRAEKITKILREDALERIRGKENKIKSLKGRKKSPETIEKMRKASLKRAPAPPETRAKCSAASRTYWEKHRKTLIS